MDAIGRYLSQDTIDKRPCSNLPNDQSFKDCALERLGPGLGRIYAGSLSRTKLVNRQPVYLLSPFYFVFAPIGFW
jgi:hypothetical protein